MSLEWPKTAVFPPSIAALVGGRVFYGGYMWSAVANAAAVSFRIVGGANRSLLNVIITCAGQATVQPSYGNSYSAAGTQLSMINRQPSSANTSTTAVYRDPTSNSDGTNWPQSLVEGGSAAGVGGVRTGAEASDDYGALIVSGDDILYTITNTSGAAMNIGIEVFSTDLVE